MKRSLAAGTGLLWLLSGCVTTEPWTPTVDTYGSSRAQYVHRDTEECRQLARQVSGSAPQQAARGAAMGGLVGAAGGAAIGAALGDIGRGAAIGGTVGAISQGAGGAAQSEQAFQRSFSNCMRQRGHRVIN